MSESPRKPVLCLTFDNLGAARAVFEGKAARPDPFSPAIVDGVPNVLRLLSDLDLRATFFIEGWSALHYRDAVRSIHSDGHEIGLHGWIHENFAELDRLRATQVLSDGVAMLGERGIVPTGFRAPGGALGPYAAEILGPMGFAYDSSVETHLSTQVPRNPSWYSGDGIRVLRSGIVNIPWQWFMIDAIHYMISPEGLRDPAELAAYWTAILRNVARHGGLLTIICHAHVSGVERARLAALEHVLRSALELGFDVLPGREAAKTRAYLTSE